MRFEFSEHVDRREHLVSALEEDADRFISDTGELEEMLRHAMFPSGKLLRPLMLLASTSLVGGDVHQVVPAAVGLEFGHVGLLAHDDIIDDDEVRRGRPSLKSKYGTSVALLLGDALQFLMYRSVNRCRERGVESGRVARAVALLGQAGTTMCVGQLREGTLTRSGRFLREDYLRVASEKTASYISAALSIGAVLGGGDEPAVDRLAEIGINLGMAFQIRDDLLPYLSGEFEAGKDRWSDLRNGRLTLPVIRAWEDGGPQERSLLERAQEAGARGDSVPLFDEVIDVVGHPSVLQECERLERSYLGRAEELLSAFPPTEERSFLTSVIAEMHDRRL